MRYGSDTASKLRRRIIAHYHADSIEGGSHREDICRKRAHISGGERLYVLGTVTKGKGGGGGREQVKGKNK